MTQRLSACALSIGLCVALAAFPLVPRAGAAVTISSNPTQNMTCSSGVCSPTAADAVLNVGDLQNLLTSSSVAVNTGSGALAQEVEDIIVANSLGWSSANGLTLDAYRSITVSQPVSVAGAGAVALKTNDGGSNGTLSFISGGSLSFASSANGLMINAMPYTLESNVRDLAAAIMHKSTGDYALSANYDASQDGTYKKAPIPSKFKGTFNGLGNTISNLSMHDSGRAFAGLFGYVDTTGVTASVRLKNVAMSVRTTDNRRGICAGSLVGASYGMTFNVSAAGSLEAKPTSNGIVAGGLIGCAHGSIVNSSANVTVNMTHGTSVGGVSAGGLAGASVGTISQSFATGTVSISGTGVIGLAGGLVDLNNGAILNSYADGSVTVNQSGHGGGLVGDNSSTIGQSYSTGAVSGGASSVLGGLIGEDSSQSGSLSNTYWDTTTSGITNLSQGAGNISDDPGITGETTAQLQSGLPAGFDPTIWAEDPNINGGLPYLIANPPQ